MSRMTKQTIANCIAETLRCRGFSVGAKTVMAVLDESAEIAKYELQANNEYLLPGIGKLKPVFREARQGRNPKTGEPILIPAKFTVKFTAVKAIKEAANSN